MAIARRGVLTSAGKLWKQLLWIKRAPLEGAHHAANEIAEEATARDDTDPDALLSRAEQALLAKFRGGSRLVAYGVKWGVGERPRSQPRSRPPVIRQAQILG